MRLPDWDRSIKAKLDVGAMALAEQIGVSRQEALAKTDWHVIANVLDAAHETNRYSTETSPALIGGVEFSGFWRPSAKMWNDYATSQSWPVNSTEPGVLSRIGQLKAAGITSASGKAVWSPSTHNLGNSVDISGVMKIGYDGNGEVMTDWVDTRNGMSKDSLHNEVYDPMLKAFSRSLYNGGAHQVLNGWETFGVALHSTNKAGQLVVRDRDENFFTNKYNDRDPVEQDHWNHFHVWFKP